MFSKAERSSFPYWFAHYCAYNMTALNCKAWKFKYLFHDIEKPFLKLFLPYEKVQKIHRKHNKHHPEWLENQLVNLPPRYNWIVGNLLNKIDYEGMIIDWECSHFTKSECPYLAFDEYKILMYKETFKQKYPNIYKYCYDGFSKRLYDTIIKLGLKND